MTFVCSQLRSLSKVFMAAVCVLYLCSMLLAQGWRGIVPIQATCKDVERQLGGNVCGKKSASYNLSDETVTIVLAQNSCHPKWPYEEYNVPPDTVTSIIVLPRYPKRLFISDLKVDESKLKKEAAGDLLGGFEYASRELGIKFTASEEGQVTDVTYFPAGKYDYLRCPHLAKIQPSSEFTVYGVSPLLSGEYNPASVTNEKQVLDKLVSDLKDFDTRVPTAIAQKTTVYVVAYAGRRSHSGQAQLLADRIKDCLVGEYNVDASRIKVVDAGYRESALVQLFIRSYGASAPSIQPTVHPNKVEIVDIKNK